MILNFFPLVLVVISIYPLHSIAAALGKLNSFTSYYCNEASVVNPTISIPINTCLVSPNAYSFSVQILPPCDTGTATLTLYDDISCANPLPDSVYNVEDNCYNDSGGGHIYAIQFVCQEVDGGSVPTTTTTATFGSSLIPIATDEPSSGGRTQSTTSSKTPSANEALPTSDSASDSTSSSTPSTSAGTANSDNSASSDNNNNNNDNSSSSGLSRNAQIGLGVGVPLAALMVALLAWWFPCKKGRRPAEHGHHITGQLPMANHQHHHTNWISQANPPQELPADRKYAYY
ncbi:MAG: hypothetical protein Q9216_004401 [Gyalolechia sp. 2 TL-2023]